VVRGVSGLRPTVALLGVGSPLTMYWMVLAKGAIGLPLWPMLTNGDDKAPRRNLHKCRYYRRGKWLTPSSQKARRLAHWFLSPVSATSLSARRKAGSYGLLSLLDGKSGNAHTTNARKSRKNASGWESGRRRRNRPKMREAVMKCKGACHLANKMALFCQ
jgi:hypothetical protein